MARVKIQPGGKVLIAVVVFGALLFLFFEFKPAGNTAKPEMTTAPAAASRESVKDTAGSTGVQPASAVPVQPAVNYANAQGAANTPIRIYFGFNRIHINKNVYCIFDRIQSLVGSEGPDGVRIVVEGNADSIGTSWYNVKLSRRRAGRVADSLSKRLGIPISHITLIANGSSKPIASNSTAAGRADNRRTDVLIYR